MAGIFGLNLVDQPPGTVASFSMVYNVDFHVVVVLRLMLFLSCCRFLLVVVFLYCLCRESHGGRCRYIVDVVCLFMCY